MKQMVVKVSPFYYLIDSRNTQLHLYKQASRLSREGGKLNG